MFTCPNRSCRKTFTSPLKALNLQQYPAEPYYACPYCLTKINENSTIGGETENLSIEKAPAIENQGETKEKLVKSNEKPPACHYHLGYLSERSQKGQIPDECLVCKEIVECMLKKMR